MLYFAAYSQDCCKAFMEFEGEMTEEKFINMNLEFEAANADAFEVHPKAIMVDISGRDVTHFDNVDKALGLTRSDELTYESISDKVIHIDEARDKIMFESGYMLAITDILAIAEDAQKNKALVGIFYSGTFNSSIIYLYSSILYLSAHYTSVTV